MIAHKFPVHSTTFVGRHLELNEISKLLVDPACRLLTLTGPGGIGKTRLAIEAASSTSFPDGVYFVALQPLTSPDFIVPAIADSVGFQFYAGSDPKQQLLDYLHDKTLLLVLDNFEHLLEGSELLTDILITAPHLRILTTSRERLNLLEEWVFEVAKLNYPMTEVETDIEAYDAVHLFVQHARRAQVGFELTSLQKPSVIRICRLVDGMPLGIELAAAWVRVLSSEEIAQEIERGLDILETPARNIEPRHRNIRAAFEPTWSRLSSEEQDVFQKLSVFRGGFTREAAEYVAGASLRILSVLVDKSLLRGDSNGRYDIHELLRQFGEEKLAVDAEGYNSVMDRHCEYYAEFLRQNELVIWIGGEQEREALRDFDNIRSAWQRAVIRMRHSLIQRFLVGLFIIYETRGWWLEAATTFDWAAGQLRSETRTGEQGISFGLVLTYQGFFYRRIGRVDEGKHLSLKSLSILRELSNREALAWSYVYLHSHGSVYSPEIIEDYDEMRELLREGLTTFEVLDEIHGKAYTLLTLGNVARDHDDHENARNYYRQGYLIERQRGAFRGMAWAVWGLADVARRSESFSEAREHMLELLRLLPAETGLRLTFYIPTLGEIEYALGNYDSAWQRFCEVLKDSIDKPYLASTSLRMLVWLARILVETAKLDRAIEVLTVVRHHPECPGHLLDEAVQILNKREMQMLHKTFVAAVERGLASSLETIAVAVLQEYQVGDKQLQTVKRPAANRALIETLTERELEILDLVADGMTNREIAESLILSVGTVKWYMSQIYGKLQVQNRFQAVARARELNLLF